MAEIHRRAMLGLMLGGAAAATMGLAASMPGPAESAPLTMAAGRPVETEIPLRKRYECASNKRGDPGATTPISSPCDDPQRPLLGKF